MCFFKTLSLSVSVADFWNHAAAYKQPGGRIQISNICAYCECVYVQAGTCGIPRFFNANWWQLMSCNHFCVIIDWSLIGRCQFTCKASIVVNGLIWFSDHQVHRLLTPWFFAVTRKLKFTDTCFVCLFQNVQVNNVRRSFLNLQYFVYSVQNLAWRQKP